MSFYVLKAGEQLGPFSPDDLRKAASEGRFLPSDLAWKEGLEDWQPLAAVLPPPPPPSSQPPPLPTAVSSTVPPPLPASNQVQSGSVYHLFQGRQFLVAKRNNGISWRNEYDFIGCPSATVLVKIEESEVGGATKIARMGNLAPTSKFDVALKMPNGAGLMRVKGGGMGGHSEVFDANGTKRGEIKRTSMFNLNFEAFGPSGTLFAIRAKGIGALAFSFKISNGDAQIGVIKDISKGDAKAILGDRIRLLESSYDYAFQIDLDVDFDDDAKLFLFASTYQLAHVMGRA